jgi:hypothetical protein
MRSYSGALLSRRSRGAVAPAAALVAAAWLAAVAAPARATITPIPSPHTSTGAAAAVQAAVDPAKFPLGRIAAGFYTGASKTLSVPANGNPVGMGDAASGLSPFPRDGAAFLVLSTGDATAADAADGPGVFPNADDGGGVQSERGSGRRTSRSCRSSSAAR